MNVARVTDMAQIEAAAHLFDEPPTAAATQRFLTDGRRHLLFAYDDSGNTIGLITGVEMTHPDNGTEMFVYEHGVEPNARPRVKHAASSRRPIL